MSTQPPSNAPDYAIKPRCEPSWVRRPRTRLPKAWVACLVVACWLLGAIDQVSAKPSARVVGRLKRQFDVAITQTPIEEAVERLSKLADLPIAVEWPLLEADTGISGKQPVDLHLADTRLPIALRLLAMRVAPIDKPIVPVVTDKGMALVAASRLNANPQQAEHSITSLTRDISRSKVGRVLLKDDAAIVARIESLVRKHITPAVWQPPGARQGDAERPGLIAVSPDGQSLNVTAPAMTHSRLEAFLGELRLIARGSMPRVDVRITGADTRVASRLVRVLPAAFGGKTFKQAVAELRKSSGASWFVDWRALQAIGVKPDQKLQLNVPEMPGDQLLQVLLEELRLPKKGVRLPVSSTIEDGVLIISTFDRLSRHTKRQYHAASYIYTNANVALADARRKDALESIREAIGPKRYWQGGTPAQGNGGKADLLPPWAVSEFLGVLIVDTTAGRHRQITAMLRRPVLRGRK